MVDRSSSTSDLEKAVEDFYAAFPYPVAYDFGLQFALDFEQHCIRKLRRAPSEELGTAIALAAMYIYEGEAPKLTFRRQTHTDPVDHARYRDELLGTLKFRDRFNHATRLEEFKEFLSAIFEPFIATLPASVCITADGVPDTHHTAPLLSIFDDPKPIIFSMLTPIFELDECEKRFSEQKMGLRLYADIMENKKNKRSPIENTPLLSFLQTEVPAPPPPEPGEPIIEDRSWYSHALLLAQSGYGKTNAIRWRIGQLIPQIRDGLASLILLEPKGVLSNEMLTLVRAQGLEDRLIFIDPIEAPVSVNLFDKGDGSAGAINASIAHVSRVLGTIATELTALQLPTMTFALRALHSLPEKPTLAKLIDILRFGKKILDLDALTPAIRGFFAHDFNGDSNIVARLNSMYGNPVYEILFDTDRPSFYIAEELQAGRLIIINAASGDNLYGQFWIEEIARIIRARLSIPERQRKPTTFIIDEAQTYIGTDLHFAEILDTAREAKIGMFIAAHHMGQIKDDHVRNSIYTNTALKFVAKTSADIHNLCRSLGNVDHSFVETVPMHQFAFFGPNMERAERVKLPLVEFAPATEADIIFFRKPRTDNPPNAMQPAPQSSSPPSNPAPPIQSAPPPPPSPKGDFDTDWKEA